ncbi:MAG: hypothetical protein AAF433_11705 [Bacteroidota bacterium]
MWSKRLYAAFKRLFSPLRCRGAGGETLALLVLATLAPAEVQSQVDTIVQMIDTIQVAANLTQDPICPATITYLPNLEVGQLPIDKDELRLNSGNNLAATLEDNGSMAIRHYGPGLSTISQEGLGSNRTTLNWLGNPLNSPSLGTIDLSIIPTFFLPEASQAIHQGVAPGPHQVLQPNISSTLHLNTGSFGQLGGGWDFRRSIGRRSGPEQNYAGQYLNTHLSFFYAQAQNDFSFQDERGRERSLPNAASRSIGLTGRKWFDLPDHSRILLGIWLDQTERDIAPTTEQLNSQASQTDRNGRFSLQYTSDDRRQWQYLLHFNHQDSYLRYQDPPGEIDNPVYTYNSQLRGRLHFPLKSDHFALSFHPSIQRLSARVNDEEQVFQSWQNLEFSLYKPVSYRWRYHLQGGVSLGDQAGNGQWIGQASLKYGNLHRVGLSYERRFRRPTLNDLYWPELGRPDLRAETINSLALNYDLLDLPNPWRLEAKLFHHRIQNAIRWLPEDGQFRPRNFARLVSTGLKGTAVWKNKNWLLGTFFQYAQVREADSDRQLPYEPELTAGGRLRYAPERFSITYRLHYQSAVNTLTVADNQLPATWLHHIDLSYTFGAFELQLRLRNLTNLNYQRVAGYPLPGRHYRLQAIYDF